MVSSERRRLLDSKRLSEGAKQAEAGAELTDSRKLQLAFWTAFAAHLDDSRFPIRHRTARPTLAMGFATGRSGYWLSTIISGWNSDTNTSDPEIRAEFVMGKEGASDACDFLREKSESEPQLFPPELRWHEPEDARRRKLYFRMDCDFREPSNWPAAFEWFKEHLLILNRISERYLRELP